MLHENFTEKVADVLTSLHGNLEFLQDDFSDLKHSERFANILEDTKSLTELIRSEQKAGV